MSEEHANRVYLLFLDICPGDAFAGLRWWCEQLALHWLQFGHQLYRYKSFISTILQRVHRRSI
jgi:hypothetical protein